MTLIWRYSANHEKNSFAKVPKNLVKSENNFMYSIIKIIIHWKSNSVVKSKNLARYRSEK